MSSQLGTDTRLLLSKSAWSILRWEDEFGIPALQVSLNPALCELPGSSSAASPGGPCHLQGIHVTSKGSMPSPRDPGQISESCRKPAAAETRSALHLPGQPWDGVSISLPATDFPLPLAENTEHLLSIQEGDGVTPQLL